MRAIAVLSGLGVVAGIVALAGCTSEGGGGSAAAGHGPVGAAVRDAPSRTPAAEGTVGSGTARTAELVESRALIRTADLSVAVTSGTVGRQAGRAEDIVLGAGGEVFGDDRFSGRAASATMTLKVPPPALIGTLDRLAALGTERSRTLSTQDVTGHVADVDSRVQSARESIARLRALYDQAVKVSDVIAIETELATRESDLEALEAEQRSLDAQTSMATVHLELTTAPPPVTRKHPSSPEHGVGGAFVTGWRHFTAAAAWVARAVATALPFLVLLALLGAGALLLRRRWPSTPSPPTTPTPDAT